MTDYTEDAWSRVGRNPSTSPSSGVASTVSVSNFPTTQPVSASALPLPSGAAQDGTDISSPTAMPTGGAGIRGWLSAIWTKLNGTLTTTVNNFPATQPVSGTFWQTTQPVSAASLPLPSGAAQDATLTGGSQKTKLVDSGGTNVASVSSGGAVKTDSSAVTQPVSGTFWQATQPVSLATNTPDVTDRSGRLLGHVTVDNLPSATHTPVTLYADGLTGITTEALATININKGGTTSSGTSYTVTTGKTFRVMSMTVWCIVPSTVGCAARVRIRSAGTVSASSPVSAQLGVGTAATAFNGNSVSATYPEASVEIASAQQVGISHIESSTIAGSASTGAGVGFCIVGYEY